jgi:hypothetical protein
MCQQLLASDVVGAVLRCLELAWFSDARPFRRAEDAGSTPVPGRHLISSRPRARTGHQALSTRSSVRGAHVRRSERGLASSGTPVDSVMAHGHGSG